MKKEHKEYLKIFIAIISLWVVHKLINHQHNEFFEGVENKKDDKPGNETKKGKETIPNIPPGTKPAPPVANINDPKVPSKPLDKPKGSIVLKPDPPGKNAPQSEPLFTDECPWYKKLIGGCGVGEIEPIEEPNLEAKEKGIFDDLF